MASGSRLEDDTNTDSESHEDEDNVDLGDYGRNHDLVWLQMVCKHNNMPMDTIESEDCNDDFTPAGSSPEQRHQMDTESLKNSDVYLETSLRCGMQSLSKQNEEMNVVQSLKTRETSIGGFGPSEKARIGNAFLPNQSERVTINGSKLFCGQFSKDGSHFLSASKDANLRFYDCSRDRLRLIRTVAARDVGYSILDAAFSPDDHQVVYSSWSESNPSLLTRLRDDSSIMTYVGHKVEDTLCRARFSPQLATGQRYIYTGCASGRVIVYDLLTGDIEKVFGLHKACVRDVSWHPYKNDIISSSWDGTMCRWYHNRAASEL